MLQWIWIFYLKHIIICVAASEGAFCGNKIVEDGEECDCGYDDEECDDKCCYPKIVSDRDRKLNSSADKGCKRRVQTECRYVNTSHQPYHMLVQRKILVIILVVLLF